MMLSSPPPLPPSPNPNSPPDEEQQNLTTTATSTTIQLKACDAINALISHSSPTSSPTSLSRIADNTSSTASMAIIDDEEIQCHHLSQLLSILNSNNNQNNNTTNPHFIRTTIPSYTPSQPTLLHLLGPTHHPSLIKLPSYLSPLLSDRHSPHTLLPQTQDEHANREAMSHSKIAITISKKAMLAGRVYAGLLGREGSWRGGLVEVGCVSGLASLVRRWGLECKGREGGVLVNKKRKMKNSNSRNRSRKSRYVKDDEELFNVDHDSDVDDDDASDDATMIRHGLLLSHSISIIPSTSEFSNWTSDARDALIDGTIASLSYAAALMAASTSHGRQGRKINEEVQELCQRVIRAAKESLVSCVTSRRLPPKNDVSDDEEDVDTSQRSIRSSKSRRRSLRHKQRREKRLVDEDYQRRHIIMIEILRGLEPFFLMQGVEVPNGEHGKMAVYNVAKECLSEILGLIGDEMNRIDESRRESSSGNGQVKSNRKDVGNRVRFSGQFLSPRFSNGAQNTNTPLLGISPVDPAAAAAATGSENISPVPPSLKKQTPGRSSSSRAILSPLDNTPTSARHYSSPTSVQPRPILSAIIGLLQKLVTQPGLEKANARQRVKTLLLDLLPKFPFVECRFLLNFIPRLSRSIVARHRLFASECLGAVLILLNTSNGNNNATTTTVLLDNLLTALSDRLIDKLPTVRARAALSLSTLLPPPPSSPLRSSMISQSSNFQAILRRRATLDNKATVRKAAVTTLMHLILLEMEDVPEFVRVDVMDVRLFGSVVTMDESVAVRKAGALALTTLLVRLLECDGTSEEGMGMVEEAWACHVLPLICEMSSSATASGTRDMFENIIWNPLTEHSKINNTRAEETAWRILSIIAMKGREERESLKLALHSVFEDKTKGDKGKMKSLVTKILNVGIEVVSRSLLNDDGYLNEEDSQKVKEAQRIGVWCLLDCLTETFTSTSTSFDIAAIIKKSKIDTKFITQSWKKLHTLGSQKSLALAGTTRACLRTMSKLASCLPQEEAHETLEELKLLIRSFELDIGLIEPGLVVIFRLLENLNKEDHVVTVCFKFINDTYIRCESEIESYISSGSGNYRKMDRVVYTVGIMSMTGFHAGEDSSTMMTSIAAAAAAQNNRSMVSKSSSNSTSKDPLRGFHSKPSERLIELIQTLLPPSLPQQTLSQGSKFTPPSTRAHAFLTLGKLCLRDEYLATSCRYIFARELQISSSKSTTMTTTPAIRSNCLLILGDLCVKYTNLVDRQLPLMATCLQAGLGTSGNPGTSTSQSLLHPTPSPLNRNNNGDDDDNVMVRRHAILLLSTLLLQDYIKWRGLLIFRFLVATVDGDDDVRHLAIAMLHGPLKQKWPHLFFNNFVESLFVLNSCKAHPIYATAMSGSGGSTGGGGDGGVTFDGVNWLSGESGRSQRMEIYEMMLKNMSDEEKIGVTARLAKDVLGGALNGGDLSLAVRPSSTTSGGVGNASGRDDIAERERQRAVNVVVDAFAILTSAGAQVGKVDGGDEFDDDDDENNGNTTTTAHLANAKGRLLSKISTKHLIETVVPILCQMKTVLEENKSPLLKNLMGYLVHIFRRFKTELTEVLAGDEVLLQELEYDTRQFEKKREEEEEGILGRDLGISPIVGDSKDV